MKLSHDEEAFLRQGIYEEVHFWEGGEPGKSLQLDHHVVSADLSMLIAAAIPDIADQESDAIDPPTGVPAWPWSDDSLNARLEEARSFLV